MDKATQLWRESIAKKRSEAEAYAETCRLQGLIGEARHFVNHPRLPLDEYSRQWCGKIAEVLSDDTIGEAFEAVAQQPNLQETAIQECSVELMREIKSGQIAKAAASFSKFCHEDIEEAGEIRASWNAVWDAVSRTLWPPSVPPPVADSAPPVPPAVLTLHQSLP